MLQPLIDLYGGNVYIDKGSSLSFKWYISKREDILKLIEFFKNHPCRSAKIQRLHLVPRFYELKDLKADLAPSDSLLAKTFKLFMEKWDKGDYYSIQNSTTISKKEIIQKRNYSTFCKTSPKIISNKLNPWYLTGFSDAESSFTVTFVKNETLKTGYYIQPSFQINLGKNDLALLEKIKSYFKKVGTITKSGSNSFMYRVRSLNDLNNIILPHFTEFPLKTQKQADFKLFTLIVDLINKKEHLTFEGIRKITSIKASMNKGLTETIKADFPDAIPVLRDNVEPKDLNPHFLSGFIEGEGSFWIGIIKKVGQR